MNKFLTFYNPAFDSQLTAQSYVDEASTHAKKQLEAKLVSTSSKDPDLKYWDKPGTIECVTVKNEGKVDTLLNPSSLADIDRMVDALEAAV